MKHKQCQSSLYSEQLLLVKQELDNTRATLEEERAQHSKTRAALQQATSDVEKIKSKLQTIKCLL